MKIKILLVLLSIFGANVWADFYEFLSAIKAGDKEKVVKLVEAGQDVNQAFTNDWPHGLTPLHQAARNNQIEVAKFLISKGAKVDAVLNGDGDQGTTPLHMAAEKGYEDIARLLLENKANIHATMDAGTVLHAACGGGSLWLAKEALKNKVDINALNKDGRVALHYAARMGNDKLIRLLVDNKAKIIDSPSGTMLHQACRGGVEWFIKDLIANGANINAKVGRDKIGVVWEACCSKNPNSLKILLAYNVETKDLDLNMFITYGNAAQQENLCTLAAHGFDFFTVATSGDSEGLSLFHSAIMSGRSTKLIKILLEKGGNVDEPITAGAHKGKTARDLAKKKKVIALFPKKKEKK